MSPRGARLCGSAAVISVISTIAVISTISTISSLVSCGGRAPGAPPLAVEFAGCAATLEPGPVCVLPTGSKLTLWVPVEAGTKVEVRIGGRPLAEKGVSSGRGLRFEAEIPPDVERVEVEVVPPGGARAVWALALERRRDVQGEIDEGTRAIHRLIQNFQLAEARERLDGLAALAPEDQLPIESRYLLAYNRGLLAAKEEDFRTALAELGRAARLAAHSGSARGIWIADEAIALRWSELGRAEEASRAYGRLASLPGARDACEEGELLNNWAWTTLLAREAGGFAAADLAEPIPLLDRALQKLGSGPSCGPDLFFDVHFNRALAELQAHRPEEAAAALAQARTFDRGSTFLQLLWELDLEGRLEIERGMAGRALAIYDRLDTKARSARSPDGLLRAALGRARASAALGDRARALRLLAEAEDLLDRESLRIPIFEGRETFVSQREGVASLKIQLLLDAGRVGEAFAAARRARTRFLLGLASIERVASLSPPERARWNEAIRSYQDKRTQVDEAAREEWRLLGPEVAPDRAARQALAEAGELDLGRAFEALGALPHDTALRPPRPGELVLAFHPLPGGWVAFAADDRTVDAHPFALSAATLDDPRALAREILAPFRKAIARAKRLRILPYGALRAVDFHALPFDGDVLLAAKPVVYGLDLGTPPRDEAGGLAGRDEVLLVADPNDNLPAARREADAVERAVERWTPRPRVVRLTSSQATGEATLRALGRARLFHFSGHGTFAGFGGWESGLRLAGKEELRVGQLLLLRPAPHWIVLSGCETARAASDVRIEGFGLANALVLAGAKGVVASARPVMDRTAPALFARLYATWDGRSDLAPALGRAQLAWRHDLPRVDWSSFRLVEP